MTYAWIQDLPINEEIYREIMAELGAERPAGLVVHVARIMDDGHLQYLDVWESEEACDRFTRERLHPVIGRALHRHQIHFQGGEPARETVEILHVWTSPQANIWTQTAVGTPV